MNLCFTLFVCETCTPLVPMSRIYDAALCALQGSLQGTSSSYWSYSRRILTGRRVKSSTLKDTFRGPTPSLSQSRLQCWARVETCWTMCRHPC